MHQIQFRLGGSTPDPAGGAHSAPPDPLAGLGEGEGEKEMEGEEKGEEGKGIGRGGWKGKGEGRGRGGKEREGGDCVHHIGGIGAPVYMCTCTHA